MENATTWVELEEFVKLSGLDEAKITELISEGSIKSKKDGEKTFVDATSGVGALVKKVESNLVSADMSGKELDPVFVEKTISTILGLHDKVISAKDETISAFKNENSFLKDALISMQEVYDDDKKTMETLRLELEKAREEIEFMKRKYRLMWGKVANMTETK
ncbi:MULTISPECIES: DUF3972 domain-containing protein [Helicobacter]|uniref:DUF3972 domain-containing protein n=1 Tax=Helicobacter typhlonius TaxID=76936 RepID=A0A099UD08_9HELI|nr:MULTISPECIES: DUF3972 domain-containing protein [Helicobacter]TLD79438.1 DUF3972 domain-containing protein [Helicobacter typhlonius]TLD86669.1 DUF3972 domain-containing protein [Helicobacter sp. MIT 03-1616]CUU39462.1 FIG00712103: Hypothetical protein [Helicobacter typhlonius]HCD72677.1 DUF3972 domain-containing protein [Helicobacter sp.]